MTRTKLQNIPTNLIMGFLGVGKTTAVINLLRQKPQHENWAVLVNEFGKVGIDGKILATAGATVKEIPGGCLCCAVGLPFKTGVNQLIKQARPHRLLIEPSGLGHPKQVLDMLLKDSFSTVLDMRASICLVDPQKLKDPRYTDHATFIDQIALSDVLVANKADLAEQASIRLFQQLAKSATPAKAVISETINGRLNPDWLDILRNPARCATSPYAHSIAQASATSTDSANQLTSFSQTFPTPSCFDFSQLSSLIRTLKPERFKAYLLTDLGWLIINSANGRIDCQPCKPARHSQIEIVATPAQLTKVSQRINACLVEVKPATSADKSA
ncbi:MAG TPA: GTP-binding protein [Crenotrichaceae bacterium]|nr:GTP-binding protein [Crenotrichaceae bacterium]